MTRLTTSHYGALANGEAVSCATLTAACGVSAKIISFGGILAAVEAPDRNGKLADVVLGFPDLAAYETQNAKTHFGALIGRYGNRIARGRFTLDGQTFQLPINDPPNTLHGGPDGFGRRNWIMAQASEDAVSLTLTSPDGDAGFPGTLRVGVTYRLDDDGALHIDYQASTDRATVLNLTNHSYFNLAGNGSGSIENHIIQIDADHFTPVDETMIPTGELADVTGTPFDFRTLTAIGERLRNDHPQLARARGYDHNWVLRRGNALGTLTRAAIAHDPASGRALTVLTTQPGVQFYTGNFLEGTLCGSAGKLYRQGDGFALETQHFPDSPNQPAFPSTMLRPGETSRQSTVFWFHTV
ncbi:aldose epimerase family protein [Lichenicoccus sp.]|uniref:aldose epimerase family protein n=1 Tax=Lichenicoccus sp. TaxID=2781899 RepID=UPI003D09A788